MIALDIMPCAGRRSLCTPSRTRPA